MMTAYRSEAYMRLGSVTAMFTVATVLVLYLGYILGSVWTLPLLFAASIFVGCVAAEGRQIYSIILMGVAVGVMFFLTRSTDYILTYVLFFAHYGVAKVFMDGMRSRAGQYILKYAYFNGCFLLLTWLVPGVYEPYVTGNINIWIFLMIMEAVFLAYDLLFGAFLRLYAGVLRRRLVGAGY